jgi:hypothetical protein
VRSPLLPSPALSIHGRLAQHLVTWLALAVALGLAAGSVGCASTMPGPEPPNSPPAPASLPAPASPTNASRLLPNPLTDVLARIERGVPALQPVIDQAERHRLQLVLGLIEPAADGTPTLRQYRWRAGEEYFYPASAIKLFAAVAVLEELERLHAAQGPAIGIDSPLRYHPRFAGEELVDRDDSNRAGATVTLRHEIRKLFLVSDNEAFNRLYEWVGQDGLARSLAAAGLGEARIVHRLSEARSALENRQYPRIELLRPPAESGEDPVLWSLPERQSEALPAPPPVAGLLVGDAYLDDGQRIEQPLDFTAKNRIALADLQRGLCAVVRPDIDCGIAGFELTAQHRALLLEAMSQYPSQSDNPRYDPAAYPDAWGKFLLPGLERVVPKARLAIYNKIGRAYGFSVENAWVVDRASGASFFLAATLYTNQDGVLNDDRYEYESVADPFLAALGEAVARELWQP